MKMHNVKIITNNPSVRTRYPEVAVFLDTGVEGVLITVRNMVHTGSSIVSHPLSGGMLPGENPYKSLLMAQTDSSGTGSVDIKSLELIENALRLLRRTPENFKGFDDASLEDFQALDLDFMVSALSGSHLAPLSHRDNRLL